MRRADSTPVHVGHVDIHEHEVEAVGSPELVAGGCDRLGAVSHPRHAGAGFL